MILMAHDKHIEIVGRAMRLKDMIREGHTPEDLLRSVKGLQDALMERQIGGHFFVDICWDFDGCVHRYDSGWIDADVIPDPPVDGIIGALYTYLDDGLSLGIYSARSAQVGGIPAMQRWLLKHDTYYREEAQIAADVPLLIDKIEFPMSKPAAHLYIDDRGYRFDGRPPTAEELRALFTPWNK